MNFLTLILTFFIGTFASFIGAMVGGGGLISIPFLMFVGLPPHIAIATNRLGAFGLEIGAIARFLRSGAIMWKYVPWFCIIAVIAGQVGTNILIETDPDVVKKVIVAFILILLPIIFLKPKIGVEQHEASVLKKVFGYIFYFLALAWAAFFAGGSATIIFYILMFFFGFPINNASATQRIPGMCLSIISLYIFIGNGMVEWGYGIALFFGMLFGGYLGAHTALKKGNAWVKMLFAVVVIASAIALLMK